MPLDLSFKNFETKLFTVLLNTSIGYSCFLAGEGRGKGVAAFIKSSMTEALLDVKRIIFDFGQCIILEFVELTIVNIYKSPKNVCKKTCRDFFDAIMNNLEIKKSTIICGDFNYDYGKESTNLLSVSLENKGFKQIVLDPTTIYGSCLDHVYISNDLCSRYNLHYPYYSDHEAVCVMLKKPIYKE